MSLSIDDVRKVAKLARLDVAEAELPHLQTQLGAIFAYVEQLKSLNTDGVEPLAHPLPVENVFREDEPTASLPVDDALRNAPARLGDYFGVPAVFDSSDESGH